MDNLALPFIVRKMFSFEHGVQLALRVVVQADTAALIVVRGFTQDGVISFSMTPTNDSAPTVGNFNIPDVPIFLFVDDKNGSFQQGQALVRVFLMANNDPVAELTSGWVYAYHPLTYPKSNTQDIRLGGGAILSEATANPAAGAEITHTIPTNEVWKIIAMRFSLVNDGTAANRITKIRITDGTNILGDWEPVEVTVANDNTPFTVSSAGSSYNISGAAHTHILIPNNIILPAGYTIGTSTVALQAGDNYSAAQIFFERFFMPS